MSQLIEEIRVPDEKATVLERLRYLLQVSHRTQAQFARLINIDPSSMSKVLAGKMSVTEPFINRVVVNLGVSKDWLLHGSGTPFAKDEALRTISASEPVAIHRAPKGAPVYDVDATAGIRPLGMQFTDDNIIGYIDMPGLDPANPVIRVSGDSMQPAIPDGALISIRRINDPSIILWGSTYLVQLEDYRLVKVIKPCRSNPQHVILHSENPDYDDIEVRREAIKRLFLVEAIINCRYLA